MKVCFCNAFKNDFCVTNIYQFIVSPIMIKHRNNKTNWSVMFSEVISFVF